MFSFLRRAKEQESEAEASRPASIGEGCRVYAIGDIHGRLDLFARLLEMIVDDCRARGPVAALKLILLGDLVDRGPNSAGVVDLALHIREEWPELVCLKGNHEDVFELALRGDLVALRFFLRIGGRETLLSYGVDEELLDGDVGDGLLAKMLGKVPEPHRDFIYAMPSHHLIEDYLFVHAGIRPGVAIENQTPSDLHWIREEFLGSNANHGHVVIHGHTITEFVEEMPNRIGIDTGAFASGRLTAIGLEGTERWFLST